MPELVAGSVDAVITDPPYSSGARQTNQLRTKKGMLRGEKWVENWFGTDNLSTIGFTFFMRGVLLITFNIGKPNSHLYIFIDWRNYPLLANITESAGWRLNNLIVWDKVHYGMGTNYRNQHEFIMFGSKGKPKDGNHRDYGNVISVKRKALEEHPTEKPEELLDRFIRYSTEKGNLILDPFLGSGTTAVACEKLKRRWLGVEISEEYCEVAARRIEVVANQGDLF